MFAMRIAVSSDLHCDVTPQNRKLVPYLVEEVLRQSPDVLVLAGDLANSLAGWGEVLRHFQPLDLLKLVVPGNHDVWIESKSALSRAQDASSSCLLISLPTRAIIRIVRIASTKAMATSSGPHHFRKR